MNAAILNNLATPATTPLWGSSATAGLSLTSGHAGPFSLELSSLERARQQKEAGMDLRGAAEQFVATAMLTPLLAEVRDDPFKSDLFHGGFTEDAFMQQFDQIIADRMSRSMNLPLVDAVYRQFEKSGAAPTMGTPGEVDIHG